MIRIVVGVVAGLFAFTFVVETVMSLYPEFEGEQVTTERWLMEVLAVALACFSGGAVVRLVTPKGGLVVLVGLLSIPAVIGAFNSDYPGWLRVLMLVTPACCVAYGAICAEAVVVNARLRTRQSGQVVDHDT